MKTMNGKKTEPTPKNGAEKPISLYGLKFEAILKALLNTKPITNGDIKEQRKHRGKKKQAEKKGHAGE